MSVQGRVLILAAVLFGVVRGRLLGQEAAVDCQQIVREARARATPEPPPSHPRATPERYYGALRILGSCPGSQATVLVQQWRDPPADSLTFARLIGATAGARIREVTEAVLAVAASEAAPRDRRFGAVQALATHFSPCLTLSFLAVTTRLDRTYVPVSRGRLPEVDLAGRAQPGVPELILQRLDDLSRTSSDTIFREAVRQAAFLMRLEAEACHHC